VVGGGGWKRFIERKVMSFETKDKRETKTGNQGLFRKGGRKKVTRKDLSPRRESGKVENRWTRCWRIENEG